MDQFNLRFDQTYPLHDCTAKSHLRVNGYHLCQLWLLVIHSPAVGEYIGNTAYSWVNILPHFTTISWWHLHCRKSPTPNLLQAIEWQLTPKQEPQVRGDTGHYSAFDLSFQQLKLPFRTAPKLMQRKVAWLNYVCFGHDFWLSRNWWNKAYRLVIVWLQPEWDELMRKLKKRMVVKRWQDTCMNHTQIAMQMIHLPTAWCKPWVKTIWFYIQ